MVGHGDEGVEAVVAFAAVVLEGFEEERGVGGGLEEATAIVGGAGDEKSAVVWGSVGDGHGWPSVPQRLKPRDGAEGLRHG